MIDIFFSVVVCSPANSLFLSSARKGEIKDVEGFRILREPSARNGVVVVHGVD